ncbi:unnamed protein product, partial [Bubo scandiacus]
MGCLQTVHQNRALSMYLVPFRHQLRSRCIRNALFSCFVFCRGYEVAPDTGGIRSHGGATNMSGHLTLAPCEQQAACVTGGLGLPPYRVRP